MLCYRKYALYSLFKEYRNRELAFSCGLEPESPTESAPSPSPSELDLRGFGGMRSTKQRNGREGCARINLCEWDIRTVAGVVAKRRIRGNETTAVCKSPNVDRNRRPLFSKLLRVAWTPCILFTQRQRARLLTRARVRGEDARHWTVKAECAKGTRNAKGCTKCEGGGEGKEREHKARRWSGEWKKKGENHIPWTVIPNAANKSNRSINPLPLHIFVDIPEGWPRACCSF